MAGQPQILKYIRTIWSGACLQVKIAALSVLCILCSALPPSLIPLRLLVASIGLAVTYTLSG